MALFSAELTQALRMEHGEQAKGTHFFLESFNKHVAQPLTITDPKKGYLIPEAKPFCSFSDEMLQHMKEIADWVQHSWCPHVENNRLENDVMDVQNAEEQNYADEEKEVSLWIWKEMNHIWQYFYERYLI